MMMLWVRVESVQQLIAASADLLPVFLLLLVQVGVEVSNVLLPLGSHLVTLCGGDEVVGGVVHGFNLFQFGV